jgi:L,D-transpeptidase YcbB
VLAGGLLAATAGCGGGAELELRRSEAIRGMLTSVPADSTIRLAVGDTTRLSGASVAFYEQRGWQTAWTGRRGLTKLGRAVHEAIGRAGEDGLPPERYRHDVAVGLVGSLDARGGARLPDSLAVLYGAQLDLLLTEGLGRLERDLTRGMFDPEKAGLDYRITTPPREATLLRQAAAGESPAAIVAALRPQVPQYGRMQAALAAFREAESRGDWPLIEPDTTLKDGVRAAPIARLRERLMAGVDVTESRLAAVGGSEPSLYDADLVEAVRHFQERHGLEPDGVVGTATVLGLNRTAAELIAELQLNLDRWRWLPAELGDRYVLVNVAGFELEVVDRGVAIEAMDVVVGQLDNQTPIFADSIRHVVVNPYWNVPDGIMARTIAPAMARDPGYLARNDMEMVDGRVRQRPGPKNSLGRYKFIFPNEFDVYLHDTPDGHLFARTERAFSSGCVRIERPRDFARMLLELQSGLDPDTLDGLVADGSERWIPLDRPLPVYLLYFTAWVQEDGTVRFHRDVYGRDRALDEQAGEMAAPETVQPEMPPA